MKIYINSFAFAPTTLQDVFATSESTHVTIVCITTFVNSEFVFVPPVGLVNFAILILTNVIPHCSPVSTCVSMVPVVTWKMDLSACVTQLSQESAVKFKYLHVNRNLVQLLENVSILSKVLATSVNVNLVISVTIARSTTILAPTRLFAKTTATAFERR